MSDAANPRDRWIPWYFVMFFLVVALVNAVMVTLAIRTLPGVVSEHPYEEGLAYNQTIAAAERQAALGFKGTMVFREEARQRGAIRFSLHDKAGKPVTATRVTVSISRPTQAGHDQSLAMLPAGEGTYSADITFPMPGQWEARVFAYTAQGDYQQSGRIIVP